MTKQDLVVPGLELARRLEGAEAAASRAFCDTASTLYPDKVIRAIPVGGGYLLHYGAGDPLNAAKGVGLEGPVDMQVWNDLERWMRAESSPIVIDLCPLADAGFVTALGERGYVIGSFETVTYRSIGREEFTGEGPAWGRMTTGVTIDVVDPSEAETWSRVLDSGFADGGEPIRFAVDIGKVRSALPRSIMMMARVDGKPAGGAGFSIHGDVTHLSGAAVLPEYRGRGIQRALTAARLRMASEQGCVLAKLDVVAGSVSHRNAVRGGFAVAYTRPQLIKRW